MIYVPIHLAVAVLPALPGITGTACLHPDALAAGFRAAALIYGAMCAAGRRAHGHHRYPVELMS